MENKFHGLPPHKRFNLTHHEKPTINHQSFSASVSLCLPAKKRKETRDPSVILNDIDAVVAGNTICLPAKKRICALHPNFLDKPVSSFDLNLEYDPKLYEGNTSTPKTDEIRSKEDHKDGDGHEDEDEDGILCAVCQSTDGDPSDPIVFCDGCNLMVHTTCYGKPLTNGVPEGDWFCTHCQIPTTNLPSPSCCLCPNKGGAVKPTNDGRWAHIVCSLFIPEVFFADPKGREGIDCLKVPPRRWGKRCYICKERDGCVLDCSEEKCGLRFHVTCGLKEELCIEYKEGRKKGAIVAGFCKSHSDLWMKQQGTGKYKIVARYE